MPRLCAPLPGMLGRLMLTVCALVGSNASPICADSKLILESPQALTTIQATTFSGEGKAVGKSSFHVDAAQQGTQRMTLEMAIKSGGLNRSEAILAPVAAGAIGGQATQDGIAFRLLEQRSQATRADGTRLDLLVIDHVKGRASCYSGGSDSSSESARGKRREVESRTDGRHVELPSDDRVVNVPLQLLFRPLALGEVDRIRFQLVLCRGKPVIQKMVAVRGPHTQQSGREVIEVRYGPDLGDAITWIASRLLPRFVFWFDAQTGDYLGHRMPLYRAGPDVLLVRSDLTPKDLGL